MIKRYSKNNDRVRIGVIGCGKMGQNHLRVLSEMNGLFDLVGFYDSDKKKADLAEIYGTRYFTSEDELIKACDAVTIACPTSLHREKTMKACQYNVNALVEKPIAETLDDANDIINAFKEKNLILTVGYIERFNPVINTLIDIVRGMEMVAVEIHRCSPFDARIFDVDVVSDLMIHDVDILVNGIMDEMPTKISANSRSIYNPKFADYAHAVMSFDNPKITGGGVDAYLTTSRATENKIRTIYVHAKGAFIRADMLNKTLSIKTGTSYEFPSNLHATYKQASVTEDVIVPQVEPLREEMRAFGRAILGLSSIVVTGEHVIRSMKVLDSVHEKLVMVRDGDAEVVS